jgi:predicted nucleotidyltransferase
MNKNDILAYLKKNKRKIKNLYGVKDIALFGSYALKQNTINSDIDILVNYEDTEDKFNSYFGLKNYLEDYFKTTVDLCREKDIKPEILAEIKSKMIYV